VCGWHCGFAGTIWQLIDIWEASEYEQDNRRTTHEQLPLTLQQLRHGIPIPLTNRLIPLDNELIDFCPPSPFPSVAARSLRKALKLLLTAPCSELSPAVSTHCGSGRLQLPRNPVIYKHTWNGERYHCGSDLLYFDSTTSPFTLILLRKSCEVRFDNYRNLQAYLAWMRWCDSSWYPTFW